MSWLYLVLAGISELGWPLGFKMSAMAQAQNNAMHTVLWLGLALLSMVTSMAFPTLLNVISIWGLPISSGRGSEVWGRL